MRKLLLICILAITGILFAQEAEDIATVDGVYHVTGGKDTGFTAEEAVEALLTRLINQYGIYNITTGLIMSQGQAQAMLLYVSKFVPFSIGDIFILQLKPKFPARYATYGVVVEYTSRTYYRHWVIGVR